MHRSRHSDCKCIILKEKVMNLIGAGLVFGFALGWLLLKVAMEIVLALLAAGLIIVAGLGLLLFFSRG